MNMRLSISYCGPLIVKSHNRLIISSGKHSLVQSLRKTSRKNTGRLIVVRLEIGRRTGVVKHDTIIWVEIIRQAGKKLSEKRLTFYFRSGSTLLNRAADGDSEREKLLVIIGCTLLRYHND